MEFIDYRRVNIDTSIVVDKSRGEKLTVNMNITFPRVPCYRRSMMRILFEPLITLSISFELGCHGYQW